MVDKKVGLQGKKELKEKTMYTTQEDSCLREGQAVESAIESMGMETAIMLAWETTIVVAWG